VQRTAKHAARRLVGSLLRRAARAVAIDQHPRLYVTVDALDALEQGLDQVDRRQYLLADRPRRVDRVQRVQAHGAGSP
jgi:hypothetical protein